MLLLKLTVLLFFAASVVAEPTGQIQVNSNVETDRDQTVVVDVDNGDVTGTLTPGHPVNFWNLRPGTYRIILHAGSDSSVARATVFVYPNLTTRLDATLEAGKWDLTPSGFSDQTGVLLVVDAKSSNALPGSLADGLGTMVDTSEIINPVSWEGLPMSRSSDRRHAWPIAPNTGEYAIVNLNDPIAGDRGSVITQVHDSRAISRRNYQTAWSTRDARYQSGSLHQKTWQDRILLFGTLGYNNLADAAPRSNVNYRLPHNGLKIGEVLGGLNVSASPKITAESRLWYNKYDRYFYLHPYMFNLAHAPRETGVAYRFRTDFRAMINPQTSATLSGGTSADEVKLGDGTHFDNIPAYGRTSGNYTTDNYGILYSWDDPSTPEDESHVYGQYDRYKSSHWYLGGQIRRELTNTARLTLGAEYQQGRYRKYTNYFPTNDQYYLDVNRVGFDSIGSATTESNGAGSVPKPRLLTISAGLKTLTSKFNTSVEIDYERFQSGAPTLKNESRPFDPSNNQINNPGDTMSIRLDPSDLRIAAPLEHLNIRAGISVRANSSLDLFIHASSNHILPRYDMLYVGYDFLEYKVNVGGYFVPLGNPGLTASTHKQVGVGIAYRHAGWRWNLGAALRRTSPGPAVWNIAATPRAYSMYKNSDDEFKSHEFSVAVSNDRPSLISALGALKFRYDAQDSTVFLIIWAPPRKALRKNNHLTYNLSAGATVDFAHLRSATKSPGWKKKLIRRISITAFAHFRSPLRYYQTAVGNEIRLLGVTPTATDSSSYRNALPFSEINVSLRASLIESSALKARLRIDVLNLFDRKNVVRVYTGTGLPNSTAWLKTEEGRAWAQSHPAPNQFGLTAEQEYRLVENDPNNFGRPRTLRILAEVQF